MKAREIILALFIVILVFSGCREISVSTRINKDGTFTRIIRITGDSSDVFRGNLPYPIDSTWSKEVAKDTTDDKDYILIYTKTFLNSDELNDEIGHDTSWRKQMHRKINVTRRFGFFYSYITFREVFQPVNPFTYLDYKNYLTRDDLLWLTGQKSILSRSDTIRFDQSEEKALRFLATSVTAEIEQIMKEGITTLQDPDLSPDVIAIFHDSIYKHVEDWEFDQPEKFIDQLSKWTANETVSRLNELEPPLFEQFNKKARFFESVIDMESYPETVEMPGLIIETNSAMLKGNQVSWEVQPFHLLFEEYELYAESRVINNWAFVILGVVLMLLIIILIVKAVKS